MIEPVHGEPALYDKGAGILFVADLHRGIEHEMLRSGVRMPSGSGELLKGLLGIIDRTGAGILVIVGDLKHNIPVASFHEEREIPRSLTALREVVDEVHLVPGNHDGGIGAMLPPWVNLHSSRGFVMGDYGIWHGHTWPREEVMASEIVLSAHIHPQVLFVDRMGGRTAERCWLRGRWNAERMAERYDDAGGEFIIMPAFNELAGGSRINVPGQRHIGTILRNGLADIQNADIYLLDGTHLGAVGENVVGGCLTSP